MYLRNYKKKLDSVPKKRVYKKTTKIVAELVEKPVDQIEPIVEIESDNLIEHIDQSGTLDLIEPAVHLESVIQLEPILDLVESSEPVVFLDESASQLVLQESDGDLFPEEQEQQLVKKVKKRSKYLFLNKFYSLADLDKHVRLSNQYYQKIINNYDVNCTLKCGENHTMRQTYLGCSCHQKLCSLR